jgi:hypothetical protein
MREKVVRDDNIPGFGLKECRLERFLYTSIRGVVLHLDERRIDSLWVVVPCLTDL